MPNEEYIRLKIAAVDFDNEVDEKKQELLKVFFEFIGSLVYYSDQNKVIRLKYYLEQDFTQGSSSFVEMYNYRFESYDFFGGRVSQTVYQILQNQLWKNKGLGEEISTQDWEHLEGCKIDYGMSLKQKMWVTSEEEWQDERINYYKAHQDEIDWSQHEWLPNYYWSNRLMINALKPIKEENFHKSSLMHNRCSNLEANTDEWGSRICEANFYTYNKRVSENEKKICGSKRKIYEIIKNRNKQYISLDFAHGMFEFHDNTGRHLGEFRFDGKKNSDPESSHNLRAIKK